MIEDSWTTCQLEDVCILITDGAHRSPPSVENNGYPMASVKDLTPFGINLSTCRPISEDDYIDLVRGNCQPLPGDVLIAKDGNSALDTVCMVKEAEEVVLLSSVAILRPDIRKVIPSYLMYYLDSDTTREYLKSGFISGAAIPRVILKDFKRAEIRFPPLPIQERISYFLSAYDDLIENNMKRIAALEATVQALYREWFVEMRFPGWEGAKWVESELGEIPVGWGISPVGHLLEQHIGGGWGQEEPKDDHTKHVFIIRGTDIPGARHVQIGSCPDRYVKESQYKSRQLLSGDIVFEVSGGSKDQPLGRALLINQRLLNAFTDDVICASFCKKVRVDQTQFVPEILYLHFQEIYDDRRIEQYEVQSTGIKNFKWKYFLSDELIIVPDRTTQLLFADYVRPLFEQITMLGSHNNFLRETRDLLLPRLISGEVSVEGLPIPDAIEG